MRDRSWRCCGRGASFAAFAAAPVAYDHRVSGSDWLPPQDSALGGLDPQDRAVLLEAGRPRRYRRGASIISQGDHCDTVHVLLSGRVRVTVDTADGREILLAVNGPGDLLGFFEAINPHGGPATAFNVALEALECRVLTGQEFRDLLDACPRIPLCLLRWAVRRLQAGGRRRVDAASLDTPQRLARLLLELADGAARAGGAQVEVDMPLTQEQLASMIAASRDAVVRALTSLRSRQLIATTRGRITILDVDALRQYGGEPGGRGGFSG